MALTLRSAGALIAGRPQERKSMDIEAVSDFVLGPGELAKKGETYRGVDEGLALSLIRRGRAKAVGEGRAGEKKKKG